MGRVFGTYCRKVCPQVRVGAGKPIRGGARRGPGNVSGSGYDPGMDWKLELVFVPVSDVDRAKAFYVDQVGFHADHDQQVSEELRFVQLTPPGSACSIAFGTGLGVDMAPGSLRNLQVVVEDVAAARKQLIEHGVAASEVDVQAWGSFVTFADPDGNTWALQQLPARRQ
jgi:catechol 2,3-dioxygenase-like lactoylglutathione lyase family enzyme